MWFLATELWPYLAGAFAIGLATGWLSGCTPKKVPSASDEAAGEGAV